MLTLVFTDLVDSVGLKSRLGDSEADKLISFHFQGLSNRLNWTGGRQILLTGDGAFLSFEIPSKAVEFALQLQEFHQENANLPGVRIGIHMGEVTERLIVKAGVEQVEIHGLAADIASRIQNLALPQQILMSYPVFDNARQRLDTVVITRPIEWRAHGCYMFQGTDTALEVFEVGATGTAPFTSPTGGSKAQRAVKVDDEEVLGWRPAQGLIMPDRPNWILNEKLGEGGFGDVWLIEHSKTRERRVIKFCYSQDKLRTLKREVTLFRLLKEYLGDRPDIARLIDFQFDESPYYLEMEFAGNHNLSTWVQDKGGVQNVPMDQRLEIVAQMAEAIAAAHTVGVLHKDIKPSNVMVTEAPGKSGPQIRVIDFGIGSLSNRQLLDDKGITATGLTEFSLANQYGSSLTGTRLYMAPELIEGKAATIKSDIYSLGVVLYQLVSGKTGQSLSFGWERDVPDELVRDDIAACVDGNPDNRLSSAGELARRLRNLSERTAQRDQHLRDSAKLNLARKRRKFYYIMAGVMCVLLIFVGQFAILQREKAADAEFLQVRAEAGWKEAIAQEEKTRIALLDAQKAHYLGAIALAEASLRERRVDKVQEVLLKDAPEQFRSREWGWLLSQISPEDMSLSRGNIFDLRFLSDGKRIVTGRRNGTGGGIVSVVELHTGKTISETQTNDRLVWNIDLGPDEKLVATASSDRIVSVMDLASGEVLHKLRGHRDIVRDVAFSPNGALLASAARDETIILWSANDYQTSRVIYQPGDKYTEIAFSSDSRFLAAATLGGHVRVYDSVSGELVGNCLGNTDKVLSIIDLGDGTSLATACNDANVRIYPWPLDTQTTEIAPRLTIGLRDSAAVHLAASPGGKALYVAQDQGRIKKFDSATGQDLNTIQVDPQLWKLAMDRRGEKLFSVARWSARLLNLQRLEAPSVIHNWTEDTSGPAHALPINLATITANRDQTWKGDEEWRTSSGLFLATVNERDFLVRSPYRIYSPDGQTVVNINPRSLRTSVSSSKDRKGAFILGNIGFVHGEFSPDGKLFAVASQSSGTIVYNTKTWSPSYVLERHENGPNRAVFTADSQYLVEGNVNGQARMVEAATGKQVRDLTPRGGGSIISTDISSDNRLVAFGLETNAALVVNLATGEAVSTMTGHAHYIHALKFTPDGNQLVTLSRDGTVKLWDIATGRELVTLFNLNQGIVPLGIAFDPEDRFIALATSDKKVEITGIFPSRVDGFGGSMDVPLEDRIELWKRRKRLNPNLTIEDLR